MEERILDNKYIINQMIGTGGMSIVYSGYSMDTGEEVAIKVLRPEYIEDEEFIRRFRKESKIAQQLRHKNIIKTIDTGEDNGLPYIVMEYIKGKTLKDLVRDRRFLPCQEAIEIGIKISEALFYAHSHKLIHRDIKPQNILINIDGTVKVTDFGIARVQDSGTITLGGSNVMGSVHYISPEQARGENTTEKADIYSLGIVMYEMVTGCVPFEGDAPVSVAIKHLQEVPVSPRMKNPQVSMAMEQIILKAISKSPEVRYDNAFELSQDLKMAMDMPEGGFVKIKADKDDTLVNIPKITKEMEIMALKERERGQSVYQPLQSDISSKVYNRTRRRKSATFSIMRIMIALVVIVGMVVTLFLIGRSLLNAQRSKPMREVPRVMGQSDETAKDMIQDAGFKAEISYEYNNLVTKYVVIKQDPQPGEVLMEGSSVYVTVSLGVQTILVPNVVNRSYTEAAYMIEDAGFVVGTVELRASEGPADYVLEQSPSANEELPAGEVINLVISKAITATSIIMPDVVLLTQEQAEQSINDMGFVITQIVVVNGNEPLGTVIKQQPEKGAELLQDTQILLWVSNSEGAEYTKQHVVRLSIPEDGTHVIIELIDNGQPFRCYDKYLDAGDHEVPLTLVSETWGEKELYVYINGELSSTDRITFAVENG